MGRKNTFRVLAWKSEGKRPRGTHGCEGTNIKWKLKGMVGVDWINLALNRDKWLALMKRALKFLFHTAENFWTK